MSVYRPADYAERKPVQKSELLGAFILATAITAAISLGLCGGYICTVIFPLIRF